MTVTQLKKVLEQFEKDGKGEHDVCYLYEESKCLCPRRPVRDLITKATVADPADGKELHLYQ